MVNKFDIDKTTEPTQPKFQIKLQIHMQQFCHKYHVPNQIPGQPRRKQTQLDEKDDDSENDNDLNEQDIDIKLTLTSKQYCMISKRM